MMKCLLSNLISMTVILLFVHSSHCQWNFSPEETEVFDLVDETKVNFYEFLNVTQDASQQDVRRSYRQLSRTMHPDKNKTAGAEENFRILVAMYEVLKNKEKREIYDNVLANGLPASYLYVPRQLRKMSFLEVSVIMALIATVGHFLFLWGAYVEKKLALDEAMPRIQKRIKKQKKKGNDDMSQQEVEEMYLKSSRPTLYDVLPVLLSRKIYEFAVWLPAFVKSQQELKKMLQEEAEAKLREEKEIEKRRQRDHERKEEQKRQKKEKNRLRKEEMLLAEKMTLEAGPLPPSVFENSQDLDELDAMYDQMTEEDFTKKKSKKEEWTEEDHSQLAKLMTKYPGGTPERWVRISKEMGRNVNEITARAKAVRNDLSSKAKYSAVTQPSGRLTQNKHADKHQIPDEIISTAYNDSDEDTLLQRLQTDNDEYSSKLKKKQETRNIKKSIHEKEAKTREPETEDRWDQSQQKVFEMALQQFPKTETERWEKIASCVPGKTKEECIARYRFIAEKIQQRRKQRDL